MLRDTTGTREQQKGLLYLCAKILKKLREFHTLYKKMQIRLPVVRLSTDLLSYIYIWCICYDGNYIGLQIIIILLV